MTLTKYNILKNDKINVLQLQTLVPVGIFTSQYNNITMCLTPNSVEYSLPWIGIIFAFNINKADKCLQLLSSIFYILVSGRIQTLIPLVIKNVIGFKVLQKESMVIVNQENQKITLLKIVKLCFTHVPCSGIFIFLKIR